LALVSSWVNVGGLEGWERKAKSHEMDGGASIGDEDLPLLRYNAWV
jgi:hypothetical protein